MKHDSTESPIDSTTLTRVATAHDDKGIVVYASGQDLVVCVPFIAQRGVEPDAAVATVLAEIAQGQQAILALEQLAKQMLPAAGGGSDLEVLPALPGTQGTKDWGPN